MHKRLLTGIFLFFILAVGTGCKQEIAPPGEKKTWMIFDRSNSSLQVDRIHTVHGDGQGSIWFGTDSGAASFNGSLWSSLKDSLTYQTFSGGTVAYEKRVLSISSSKGGSLWFGLGGGGLIRFDRSSSRRTWSKYRQPDIPVNVVFSVTGEKTLLGEVWVGTSVGLARFTPDPIDNTTGEWHQYTNENSILRSNVIRTSAFNLLDNSFWFGSQDGEVISYRDLTGWELETLPSPSTITSIAFDLNYGVWVGTWRGVAHQNTKSRVWTEYTAASTGGKLPPGNVNAVATDLYATKWFGTTHGLAQLTDSTTWTSFSRSSGHLPSDTVTSLFFDAGRKNLWIGTTKGIAVHNPNGISY